MNKYIYVPVRQVGEDVVLYYAKAYKDLGECLNYIIDVRRYLPPGARLTYIKLEII